MRAACRGLQTILLTAPELQSPQAVQTVWLRDESQDDAHRHPGNDEDYTGFIGATDRVAQHLLGKRHGGFEVADEACRLRLHAVQSLAGIVRDHQRGQRSPCAAAAT